jgi:hypothetical protein
MKVEKPKETIREKRIKQFWMQVIQDYNAGIPVPIIAKRYRNPQTGKHYHRTHIYWILRQADRI